MRRSRRDDGGCAGASRAAPPSPRLDDRGRARARRAALPSALALASLLALAACAPVYGDAYLHAFASGERALHAGRYEEAARAYDEAASKALRVKDRDEARFLQARCLEKAGRFADAEAALRRLLAESPKGPRSPRAEFEIAELTIAHGDAAQGRAMLDAAARRYPNHGLAAPALRRLLAHVVEEQGDAAAIAFLRARREAFRNTDQDEVLLYEEARAIERTGDAEGAHAAYLAVARAHPYPYGALYDDALWRAAEIDEAKGRGDEAVAHLRELLAGREKARGIAGRYDMASYTRPRFPAAQLKIAELYRDVLHDRAAARREFEKLDRDYPTSTKRDDALWAAARLAKEDGDARAACRLAERIVTALPDSRYAPCARSICPTAPASKRACAGYIQRELDGRGDAAPDEGSEAAEPAPASE